MDRKPNPFIKLKVWNKKRGEYTKYVNRSDIVSVVDLGERGVIVEIRGYYNLGFLGTTHLKMPSQSSIEEVIEQIDGTSAEQLFEI